LRPSAAKKKKKEEEEAGSWWLKPVVLATQEAEIRRIRVQSQPRQIAQETLSQKHLTHKRTGRVAQGVVCRPNKCEALSSIKLQYYPPQKKKKD
jgi:hypothetical protein